MNVTELYRYPVKSMLGESLPDVQVGENGFAGDRVWALRSDNLTLTGKKFPALMSARARFTGSDTASDTASEASHDSAGNRSKAIDITLPNGEKISSTDKEAGTKLGDWLKTKVALWPLVSADDLEFFKRRASAATTPEQMEQELRAVFARLPDEPLPDLASFPPEIMEYDSPPGTYFDAYPILLMSQQSLETLSNKADNNFDLRRFRPNIVVSGASDESSSDATEGFPENSWVGKRCQLGEVVLSIEMPCPRCIMTTHPVADVPKDPNVMRQLVTHNSGNLGVYAKVITQGTIRCGDKLEVIAP